ncbi:MAG: amidophosphoribosyltransferase [Clostridia bacterium]|nr:amidophosphoribosyltransferase [Clostridia bacterium]
MLSEIDKLKEECGVFGIYDSEGAHDVAKMTYYGLYALQHRGQESAGIAVSDGDKIHYYKRMGLVPEIFDSEILDGLKGKIAVGHVMYSTQGTNYPVNAQPLVIKYRKGSIALAHNGNLVNADRLRSELEEEGIIFQTSVDSEVMANLISRFAKTSTVEKAIRKTMEIIKGAYALVMMTEDKLIGFRDPYGIRPLSIGKKVNSYILASETCAFDTVGADTIRDVQPGEIVVIDDQGIKSFMPEKDCNTALCIFEFIYFARTDSIMNGMSVYMSRKKAGRILAQEHPVDADLVIGVPDSGTTAAIGYAEQSGIKYGEGLIKNRYVGRTFIQPTQELREQGVDIKLNALKSMVEGKRIIMVDDSIVRGTTSGRIVDMLRRAGAKEIHMRISSPPVKYPCYFGIDTPERKHLIGAQRSVQEIEQLIGADSLAYISIEGLMETVDVRKCGYCKGCFNGIYPVEVATNLK